MVLEDDLSAVTVLDAAMVGFYTGMMACDVSGFVAAAMKFMADIDAVEESQAGTMNAQLMLCANGAISYRGHEMTYGFSFAESCVASLFGAPFGIPRHAARGHTDGLQRW